MKPIYLIDLKQKADARIDRDSFPGNLPFVDELQLEFESPVTFFVGENGSGKSTLLEAMAVLSNLPIAGGGTNEVGNRQGVIEQSELANILRLAFARQPKDRYFFRAETQAHFASLLSQRRNDPEFRGDPFARYGGKPLEQMSHGEAFLSVMQNRFDHGLFLLDEPESALSPQRQLTLLTLMYGLVKQGKSQFIIATHSPILLTFPGASIITFDRGRLEPVKLEDTSHFRITHSLLQSPESYWRHLVSDDDTV